MNLENLSRPEDIMLLNQISQLLDTYLHYTAYPDFIVDLLQEVDTSAITRFQSTYLKKHTGLMVSNGEQVNTLYCAVFPSDDLVRHFNERDITNALLVVKHPMDWEEMGRGFIPISTTLLTQLRQRSLSLYCAHAAHDNCLDCSPSKKMAQSLKLRMVQVIRDENGRVFGYIVESDDSMTFAHFKSLVASIFVLEKMQQRYLHDHIRRIAVVAGGGDNLRWLEIAEELGCDTYLTGILHFRGSDYAKIHNPLFINRLKQTSMNAIGISHYLSERDGSIALAEILASKLKIATEFLPETNKQQTIRQFWGRIL